MGVIYIQNGDTERLYVHATDSDGDGVTGDTITLILRDKADGYTWSGSAFTSGHTTVSMTETDVTNLPGTYHYDFTSTRNDVDIYALATAASASVVNSPWTTEVKIGNWLENLDAPISTVDTNVDTLLVRVPDTVSLANINAEVDTALTDYDGPTDTEMDAAFAALNDLSAAQVNAEVDTALADYDAPTKAEMDTGFAALNDLSAAQVNAEVDTALTDYDAVVPADLPANFADLAIASGSGYVTVGGLSIPALESQTVQIQDDLGLKNLVEEVRRLGVQQEAMLRELRELARIVRNG